VGQLVLMRHGRATHKTGFEDVERPLTGRGRRDAAAAGSWLRDQGLVPDLVLCSPALRTRRTWDELSGPLSAPPAAPATSADPQAAPAGRVDGAVAPLSAPPAAPATSAVEVWYDSRLYLADDFELREIIAETPDEVGTLLVIGHNPTIEQVASGLTSEAGLNFPTSAIAVVDVASWVRLPPGAGTLRAFWVPTRDPS
jgi:phosphohistidine phosphatase